MKTIIISILFFLSSCVDREDFIQEVYVNIEIPVNQPEFSGLGAIGNSIFVSGGVKGIIIYHANINDYRAFDRNCSFEPSSDCSYIDSINSIVASCNCCDSKFLIDQNGITANGPALMSLKEYFTSFNNGILKIKN